MQCAYGRKERHSHVSYMQTFKLFQLHRRNSKAAILFNPSCIPSCVPSFFFAPHKVLFFFCSSALLTQMACPAFSLQTTSPYNSRYRPLCDFSITISKHDVQNYCPRDLCYSQVPLFYWKTSSHKSKSNFKNQVLYYILKFFISFSIAFHVHSVDLVFVFRIWNSFTSKNFQYKFPTFF